MKTFKFNTEGREFKFDVGPDTQDPPRLYYMMRGIRSEDDQWLVVTHDLLKEQALKYLLNQAMKFEQLKNLLS
jgi:hypothetical protein